MTRQNGGFRVRTVNAKGELGTLVGKAPVVGGSITQNTECNALAAGVFPDEVNAADPATCVWPTRGLALGPDGSVYIGEYGANAYVLRRLGPDGKLVRIVGGLVSEVQSVVGAAAARTLTQEYDEQLRVKTQVLGMVAAASRRLERNSALDLPRRAHVFGVGADRVQCDPGRE